MFAQQDAPELEKDQMVTQSYETLRFEITDIKVTRHLHMRNEERVSQIHTSVSSIQFVNHLKDLSEVNIVSLKKNHYRAISMDD